MKKREFLYNVGENVNWLIYYEKSMEVHQKLKVEVPSDPAILLLVIYPKEMIVTVSKRYLHSHVHWIIVYNHKKIERT